MEHDTGWPKPYLFMMVPFYGVHYNIRFFFFLFLLDKIHQFCSPPWDTRYDHHIHPCIPGRITAAIYHQLCGQHAVQGLCVTVSMYFLKLYNIGWNICTIYCSMTQIQYFSQRPSAGEVNKTGALVHRFKSLSAETTWNPNASIKWNPFPLWITF